MSNKSFCGLLSIFVHLHSHICAHQYNTCIQSWRTYSFTSYYVDIF